MAKTENSSPAKFDKDALIKWLNLSDLSERWECKTADLIHYAAQGKLCLSVIADYWYLDYFRYQEKELIKDHRVIYQGDLLRIDESVAKDIEIYGTASVYRARRAENETFIKVDVKSPSFSRNHPGGHALPEAPPVVSAADIVISADELIRFEQEHGINQPGMTAEVIQNPHEPKTTIIKNKLDKQIEAIIKAIRNKEWDALKIPDGGKILIRKIVTDNEPKLFEADTAFDTAWKGARSRELVKMENHDSYARSNR